MLTDKDLALRLLDWIEDLHLRNAALEAALEVLSAQDWRPYVEQLEKKPHHKATIHAKFEPFRELVLDAPDLTAAVRHMLEGLERIDPEEKGNQ